MKRIVLLLVCILSLSIVFAAFDKNESDRLFYEENDYEADFAYLSEALSPTCMTVPVRRATGVPRSSSMRQV